MLWGIIFSIIFSVMYFMRNIFNIFPFGVELNFLLWRILFSMA